MQTDASGLTGEPTASSDFHSVGGTFP